MAVLSRNQERVDAAVAELQQLGGEVRGYSADVREYEKLEAALKSAAEALGPLDIVVAGQAGNFYAPALGMSANGFKSVVDIDLIGTFNVFRACNALLKKPGAALIAITAPEAVKPLHFQAHVCAAKAGVFEGDASTVDWIVAHRPGADASRLRSQLVAPDQGAEYTGGVHRVDLSKIEPMVATPGDAAKGISSDPTNGALIREIGEVRIDIAYGGSCTAGKEEDLDMYARVMTRASRGSLWPARRKASRATSSGMPPSS